MEEDFRFFTLIAISLDILPDRNKYVDELMERVGTFIDSVDPESRLASAYEYVYERMQAYHKTLFTQVSATYQHVSIFITNQIIII